MTRKADHAHHPDRTEVIKRMNRIAGQVSGVARMLEEGRYCIDVLTQMQAIKSALSRAEDVILIDHTEHCVAQAVKSGSIAEQKKKIDELVELFAAAKR